MFLAREYRGGKETTTRGGPAWPFQGSSTRPQLGKPTTMLAAARARSVARIAFLGVPMKHLPGEILCNTTGIVMGRSEESKASCSISPVEVHDAFQLLVGEPAAQVTGEPLCRQRRGV